MVTIEGSKSDWTDNEDILTISNDLKAIFNSIAINMECNKNYSKGNYKIYFLIIITLFLLNYALFP